MRGHYLRLETLYQDGHQQVKENVIPKCHESNEVESSPGGGRCHAVVKNLVPVFLGQNLPRKGIRKMKILEDDTLFSPSLFSLCSGWVRQAPTFGVSKVAISTGGYTWSKPSSESEKRWDQRDQNSHTAGKVPAQSNSHQGTCSSIRNCSIVWVWPFLWSARTAKNSPQIPDLQSSELLGQKSAHINHGFKPDPVLCWNIAASGLNLLHLSLIHPLSPYPANTKVSCLGSFSLWTFSFIFENGLKHPVFPHSWFWMLSLP